MGSYLEGTPAVALSPPSMDNASGPAEDTIMKSVVPRTSLTVGEAAVALSALSMDKRAKISPKLGENCLGTRGRHNKEPSVEPPNQPFWW